MPLPKPQTALLFNNYYDYNTGEGVLRSNTDFLNVFMIAADAYFTFGNNGNKPNYQSKFKPVFQADIKSKEYGKHLVLTEVPVEEYPSPLKTPGDPDPDSFFQLFKTSEDFPFLEVTSESLALFLQAVETLSPKEKIETTIDFLKNNMKEVGLYNATIKFPRETIVVLDALYSNKTIDDKLSVPYVAGSDPAAAGQAVLEGLGEFNNNQFAGGAGNFAAANSFTNSQEDLKNQPGVDSSKLVDNAGGDIPFEF